MSLERLAKEIFDGFHSGLAGAGLGGERRAATETFVLVTPDAFSLRAEFLVALVDSITAVARSVGVMPWQHLQRNGVEIDFLRPEGGWFAAASCMMLRRRCRHLQRLLRRPPPNDDDASFQIPGGQTSGGPAGDHVQPASVQANRVSTTVRLTAILGRNMPGRPLVIGCCNHRQSLPDWALPIELAGQASVAA